MKRKIESNILLIFILILLAVLSVILFAPWKSVVLKFKTLLHPLLMKFDTSLQPNIGYIAGFILLIGIASIFIKYLVRQLGSKQPVEFVPAPGKNISVLSSTKSLLPSLPVLLLSLSMVLILFYYGSYIVNGQDTYVKIFDVLDAWVPQVKVLAESGKAFSFNPETQIPNLANGLRLSGFHSGYNVSTWLFMVFKPFVAYTLNLLIMAFTAFWGMALLLKRFYIKSENFTPLIIGSSLCYSLLSFYPPAGLSIAGFPLLLYLFFKIRMHEAKKRDYLFIGLFPFYSLLHHAGMFIIMVLGIIFIWDIVKRRDFNKGYLFALSLLGVGYIFTHFHLFYTLIDPDFMSYREEIKSGAMPAATCFKETVHNFLFDRTNVVSGQQVFILLAAAGAILIGIFRTVEKPIRQLILFILLALGNSFLWGYKYWEVIAPIREKYQILNALNLARFFWLNPFLWGMAFALSLLIISKIKFGKLLVSLLIVGQLVFIFTTYNPGNRNWLGLGNRSHSTLTFKQFYSEDLFKEINNYIGRPQKEYRTICLGLHPGVLQYNGYYTLDFYVNIYSLNYKHKFRQIIEKEIEKDDSVKRVFDENGKRCYLFVSDIYGRKGGASAVFSKGITKQDSRRWKIRNMDLNFEVLKEMGGEYIFSAVEIQEQNQNKLHLEKIFERNDSPWKIFLYKVL